MLTQDKNGKWHTVEERPIHVLSYSFFLESEESLRQAVEALIAHSQAFEVTPFPDDEWRVRVKPEEGTLALVRPWALREGGRV